MARHSSKNVPPPACPNFIGLVCAGAALAPAFAAPAEKELAIPHLAYVGLA
jgi:hypothetical protein